MGPPPDPIPPPSFDDFQRQASLMTSCTLLWKELTDHFTSLEEDILRKSEAIKRKIETLEHQTKESLEGLKEREVSIDDSVQIAVKSVERCRESAITSIEEELDGVDDGEGLLLSLKRFCLRMDALGFWRFASLRKKELEELRECVPLALKECVDPTSFALEAVSEVFPVDKREDKSERLNDLGWACVLVLESLIPVLVDPVIGKRRILVTPSVRSKACEVAEEWKLSLEKRGGVENVKTPDVHTFLQHLVTFGIVKEEDFGLYRRLIVGSAWRKQMPKLAVALGLSNQIPDMIKELISRRQQLDAVHFAFEVGLVDKFPPVPLLKTYLRDAKKAVLTATGDHNNSTRATSGRKEQSALRAVIKCIEEYKLEIEFPPGNLKKRLEQLEKAKTDKKKPVATAVPANKRTRVSTGGGPMPPAKAGRSTNAYVSSSFQTATTFAGSPSQTQPSNGSPHQTQLSNGSPHQTQLSNGSPHQTQLSNGSPHQTQHSNGSPHQTQQSNNSPYQTQHSNGSPYQTQHSNGSPYQTQHSNGSPYQTQHSNGSPYQTQHSNGSPYQTQHSNGSPSQTQLSNGSPSQRNYTIASPLHSPYTISPSHSQYTISPQHSPYATVSPPYLYDMQAGPVMYGNRSPPTPYGYSLESVAFPHTGPYAPPHMVYPPYYGQNMAPVYHQQPYC